MSDPNQGKGSRRLVGGFTICARLAAIPQGGEGSNENIIVLVEDNPDDALLTLRMLERNGVTNQAIVIPDGAQALSYFLGKTQRRGSGRGSLPLVVLLDLGLPKVDGLEVLRQIRSHSRTRRLPVVALASPAYDETTLQRAGWEATTVVPKPIDFEKFSKAVLRVGLSWLLLSEPLQATRA